ncbi:MAG: exo-alpha-sialidase, partial [Actinomycetota bacterium]|nr:exo-alpha-sialidase [Actinomycetota bacterium]
MSPAPAALVGTVRVGPNVRVGDEANPLRADDVPALAADPADPNHIVEVDEDFLAARCVYRTTFDGGTTWTRGELAAPADFPQTACSRFDGGDYAHVDGSVVFGSGQNVYTTFSWNRPGETDASLVAHSTDGGRTFAKAVVAINGVAGADSSGNEGYVRPKVGVLARPQGDRLVVASWLITLTGTSEPQQRRATVAVSDDGGATWSAPVNASPPDQKARELSQPVVGPDGAIYVAWRTLDPAPAPNFLIVAKSTDRGATWTQVQAGPATGTRGSDPKLALDPTSSTLLLAYWNTPAGGDGDVFVRRSSDGGATWSAEVRVNDDAPNNGVIQRLPQISVAPDGRIDVAWHDRRNAYKYPTTNTTSPLAELAGARLEDYYYAYSTDGGRTFSPNRRLTDRSIDLDTGLDRRITGGFYWPALAPLGTDRLMVAWGDSRLGNSLTDGNDIVTATVQLNAGGPVPAKELPKTDPTSQSVLLSRLAYPGGGESISVATGTARSTMAVAGTRVVIANRGDAAAALAGSVLARANDGPLLLSGVGGLTKDLKDEVGRLKPVGAYVLGGTDELSATVVGDLTKAGVPADKVVRIAATGPELARQVADAMDIRSDADKTAHAAAFDGAVVVNPATDDAGAATALAAALRLPILFSDSSAVPQPTIDTLTALGVQKTIVVGGAASVAEAAMAKLPAATRLGGTTPEATSDAVAREMKVRGLPSNVAYAVRANEPAEAS